ncbi:MAG: protein kinase domain-containing protein [Chloroflexota bacterium]
MPFADGETIGPYRIVEQLGQGGMATVYKAYHAALDRYVALKVLHPAFGEDLNFEARFKREARLVAKLDHPNIVPIYDYSEHEKRPFLVMKFIEGETLKARMVRGPLSSSELTKIIEAVGAALSYAHKMGILHRDIKPSNVLLTNEGPIYLADFGLARIASMGESTLSGDMIMGTPQYISPEQAMGKKNLDEGTDIYSFGVMLYEMTVGQVPFNADTPFSIIHDHIYTPLPIPRAINPDIPESVERVLLKALSKERADRYATIADMVTAFKQAWSLAGVPIQGTMITLPPHPAPVAPPAASPSAPEAAAKPKKKISRWMLIAGAVILFLCCLFAFSAIRRGGLFPSADKIATRTAAAQTESTTIAPQTPIPPAELEARNLIDNFEGKPPAGTSGWEGYFDEATDTQLDCSPNAEAAHSGAHSLRFKFDVAVNSWATCGFYFNQPENWSAAHGISFHLRADRAGLPLHVDLYGGAPGALTTYYHAIETTQESVDGWIRVELRWDQILRAEWEENPGKPFDPNAVTGFSIGLATGETGRVGGTVWLDDLKLLNTPIAGAGEEAVTSPEILEAQRAVSQNPDDAFAHLRLSLAYWDADQPRLAYETLGKGAELAGQDQAFFVTAGGEFAQREAWIAAAGMYQRAVLAQPGGKAPPELLDSYHEAVYKAAASEDLPLQLTFNSIARVDEPLAFIAEGRFSLHRGDNAKARDFLERARGLLPTMPEVFLLDAEITIKEDRKPEARQLLEQLLANPDTPEWVRVLAESYLVQIP